ncbi:MAG: GAF domain-containing protein, partial [Thermodesulfobacteriota bacterium]
FHAGPLHVKHILEEIEREGHIFSRDAATDPRLENHEAKRVEGIASLLSVPVKVGGELVGVLTLYTSEPREFSPEEIEFVTALAEQGGMTVERARLVERYQGNLSTFLDVNSKLNSSLEIKDVLTALTEEVAKAFQVKAAAIRLLDEDKQEWPAVAYWGLSDTYLNKGPITSQTFINQILKGEPIYIEDAAVHPAVPYHDHQKAEGVVSVLCAPVLVKNKVIGALIIFSGTRRRFREDEVRLAQALAHSGGLAIQNANLYLMLQSEMKDLKDNLWGYKSWF